MKRILRYSLLGITSLLITITLGKTAPVFAQPVLLSANPAPGAVLRDLPASVELVFDRALDDVGTWITVTDSAGNRYDRQNEQVDPSNRFRVTVVLNVLLEGQYTVNYQATSIGGSTTVSGSYNFTIDLPEPDLLLLSPERGYVSEDPALKIVLQTRFFDFGIYNNHVHLYVDGKLEAELRQTEYTVSGLSPGVHEIRVVLAHFEEEEIPQTGRVVYIAIANTDEELQGREAAAAAVPDSGLKLDSAQWSAGIAIILILLGLGVVMGYNRSG